MAADTRPTSAGRRGPIRREPPLRPTGFRVDDRTRDALQMAGHFTEPPRGSMQSVLELAVEEFLARMQHVDGFARALRAAASARRRQDDGGRASGRG